MNNVTDVLQSVVRPAAICLVAGLLKGLYDYRGDHVLESAIIDGAISALTVGAGFLSVNGAVNEVKNAIKGRKSE